MDCPKFFTACFLLLVGVEIQAQSISGPKTLVDEVNVYMKPLMQEMDAKMLYYTEKHPIEGMGLRGISLYSYSAQNELLEEKGFSGSGYSRTLYRNGKKTEYTYIWDETFSRDRYDENENLVEEQDYYNYADHPYGKKHTYRFETRQSLVGDTVTILRYNNNEVDRRTVIINDSLAGKTERRLYYFDRTEPQAVWMMFLTPDRKGVLRNTYWDKISGHYSVSQSVHSPDGKLLQSTDSSEYGKSEYLYYYNAQGQKVKGEYKKNGQLEWWYLEEYDAAGHLVKSSGFDANGPSYVCVYEYDEKGNKLSYLYYYRGY